MKLAEICVPEDINRDDELSERNGGVAPLVKPLTTYSPRERDQHRQWAWSDQRSNFDWMDWHTF